MTKKATRIIKCELMVSDETLQDFINQGLKEDHQILNEYKDYYFPFNEKGKRTKEREDFYLSIKVDNKIPDEAR